MKRHRDVDPLCHVPRSDDLGPLFSSSSKASPKLTVKLHSKIATSQAEERRQQARIGKNARAVLNWLRAHGPATRNELEEGTGIRINVICSTVASLRERGMIVQLEATRDGGHLLRATPNSGYGDAA